MVNKNIAKKANRAKVGNHRFVGCRDAVMLGGTGSSPGTNPLVLVTNSSGATSGSSCFAPLGLTAVRVVSGVVTIGGTGNVTAPLLRGLYNRAVDFQMYRVTRAKLVFVGNVGSTSTGILTLCGYTSAYDVANTTGVAQISGANTRVFDLASSSSKELSVPVPVDTSWKKVSSILSTAGVSPPMFGQSDSIVPAATVDDLAFCSISYAVSNGGASSTVGYLFLDYDVEFKGVIDAGVNI